ncbi:MAG: polysaccharide deacetylase family protein [Acidobacteriaceae bacterium]|nr:polysaccharide deacetylase family protein [Acidobacteriaceae bacterium]
MKFRALFVAVLLTALSATLAAQQTTPATTPASASATQPKPGQKLGEIAITFDDLPSHGALPPGVTRMDIVKRVLAVIEKEQLPPVTGMVNGARLQWDPKGTKGVLEAWRDAEQPLASHGFTHLNLNEKPLDVWTADVEKNEPLLQKLAAYPEGQPQKQSWKYLRFPYLGEGETPQKRAAARTWLTQHGYLVAEVTMSWGDYAWNETYARCSVKHDDVAIKRLHDTYLAAARQNMWAERIESFNAFGHDIPHVLLLHIGAFDAVMFSELVAQIRADGYKFVSLPQAEMDAAYSTPPNKLDGGGLFEDQVSRAKGLAIPHRDSYEKELAAMCR